MNPLVGTTPETTSTLLNFPPPLHLKHRPSFMIPYEPFDGQYIGATDAKYLSLGAAQYRGPDDPDAVSAKTWRYVDGKWSRMSEEVPLHRIVDLCAFLAQCLFDASAQDTVIFPAGTFEGQANSMEARLIEPLPEAYHGEQRDRLAARLTVLRDVLIGLPL